MSRIAFPPIAVSLALILLLLAAGQALAATASDVPRLAGRVNDYANLLTRPQSEQLEQTLAQYERETGNQVAILTVPSLGGQDIESYSIRVAEAWKIGQKGKDNGVILVVAPNDRRVRIEVGYGLEGVLPDILAARIIRSVLTPAFQSGQYYTGIAGAVDAIMRVSRGGEFTAPPSPAQGEYQQVSTGPHSRRAPQPHLGAREMLSFGVGLILLILMLSTRTGRWLLFYMMLSGVTGGRGGGRSSGGGGSFGGGGSSGRW